MKRLNFPMVARAIGWLLLVEALFMLVPAVVSFCAGEADAVKAFGLSAAFTAIVGAISVWHIRPSRRDMGRREGFLLTGLVWVVFSLFGMLPYILAPTARLSVSAAFFEAMSGFTTTGLSLMADIDGLSHAVNLWRHITQWIGGLGIILFTLAVLPMLTGSGGSVSMFNAEATGVTLDKISPRVSSTAKRMWSMYLVLTAALFTLLWVGPMNAFDAACHAMATVSTGGFSTRAEGLNAWPGFYVKSVVTLFMFMGGVNFALLYRLIAQPNRLERLRANDTLRTFIRVIVAFTVIFAGCVLLNGAFTSWQSVTIDPLFQVVSAITSTGYELNCFSAWGVAVMGLTLMLMFSGGCAGSTSGGAKIDRVVYLLRFLHNELNLILRPNAVRAVRVNGRTVPAHMVSKVVAFLVVYLLVMIGGGTLLSLANVPLGDAFYASFACVSNAGVESPMSVGALAAIPQWGRYLLALLMLIGRLELFTVLILFTPSFWRK